jgi:endonuclease III
VRTLLSQNTTDTTSARAFDTLKLRFPSWDMVRTAPLQDVADAIRVRHLVAWPQVPPGLPGLSRHAC